MSMLNVAMEHVAVVTVYLVAPVGASIAGVSDMGFRIHHRRQLLRKRSFQGLR